jgi:hypothetical protein
MTTAKRVRLECEHEVWMKPPLPQKNDTMFCVKCNAPREVGIGTSRNMVEYWPDYDWKSIPLKPGYRGECLIEECDYHYTEAWDWYRLRAHMENHHLRIHAETPLLTFQTVPIPGSQTLDKPPF